MDRVWTFDDVSTFLLEHWRDLTESKTKLKTMSFSRMQWADRIIDSRSCPKSRESDWQITGAQSKGYPGWYGRVIVDITGSEDFLGSMILLGLGIHTGTGGPSNGYDVIVYADDFPGLTKDICWAKLRQ